MGILSAVDVAAASIIAAVGGAIITGLFGIAFLLLRRRTEREQLNATVIGSAAQMVGEYRTQHADDVAENHRLRDELKGVERELSTARARLSHVEQELRARDAADVLTHQVIDRLEAQIAELKGQGE